MHPLGTILKYHEVQYHIYAKATQIYMYLKLNDPQLAIYNINKCIPDLRTWMITNRLKIIIDGIQSELKQLCLLR